MFLSAPTHDSKPPTNGPPWLGPILHRTQIDIHWMAVALIMVGSGMIFFGWRGLVEVCVVALVSFLTFLLITMVLHLLWAKHTSDSILHAIALSLLLGVILPPMTDLTVGILSAVLLGAVIPFVGRARRLRLHPVALALVFAWLLPAFVADHDLHSLEGAPQGSIEAVLRPDRIFIGDLRNYVENNNTMAEPWWNITNADLPDAVTRNDPGVQMLKERKRMLQVDTLMVNMLQAGELCRLEEVLLGSVPGSIGGSSRVLIVLLGVYLMYRRMGTWQIPLIALLSAIAALLIMPLTTGGPEAARVTIVAERLFALSPRVAITYVSYFILASPLPLIMFLLAPMAAPMCGTGRALYGLMIGTFTIALLWALASPQAAYLSLVAASLLSRPLDVMKHSPFTKS